MPQTNINTWQNTSGNYSNQYKPETYDPATASASKAEYTAQQVDPSQTTRGLLEGMVDSDSSYMQRAAAKGTSYANARGLQNTSMGAGASQAASIDAALPVASQDAGLFADQRLANQKYQHDTSQLNAQLGTSVSLQNAGFQNDAGKLYADAINNQAILESEYGYRRGQMGLEFELRGKEQQIANDHAIRLKEMGVDSDKINTFNEATGKALQQLTDASSAIYQSTLPAGEKRAALEFLMKNYQSQVNTMAILADKKIEWSSFDTNAPSSNIVSPTEDLTKQVTDLEKQIAELNSQRSYNNYAYEGGGN